MAVLSAVFGPLLLTADSVRHGDTRLELTSYEFEVLRRLILTQAPGDRDITTHVILEDHLRGAFDIPLNRNVPATVQVMLSRLRKKLRAAGTGVSIKAVRGAGYTLVVKAQPGIGS